MRHADKQLRKMVIDAVKSGKCTQAFMSELTGYSKQTINKWCRNNEYEAKPNGHRKASFSEGELKELAKFIDNKNDATLKEVRDHFGKTCSISSVYRALVKIGYSHKKKYPCLRGR